MSRHTRPYTPEQTLRTWGYIVTTHGGWIAAAGHGALHRWHGWDALPSLDLPWRGGFDGAANPNPGPAAWGAWLDTPLGDSAWSGHDALGDTSNNVAEWNGLLHVLTAAQQFAVTTLQVQGDSQLVIRQFTGEYALRNPRLQTLAHQAQRLARGISVTAEWVPRDQNHRADALSQVDLAVPHITFDVAALESLGTDRFVAHGTHDYVVDVSTRTCTCPAFQFRRGLCKHLRAAGA